MMNNKSILLLLAAVLTMPLLVQIANAQQQTSPKATIWDTKTLTIKNPKFIDEDISYSITGTVMNKSQREAALVFVYAILYDANNNIINVAVAPADVSSLKPGADSAFKVPFSPAQHAREFPNHYTLVAGEN
jgi:hypothetical protein